MEQTGQSSGTNLAQQWNKVMSRAQISFGNYSEPEIEKLEKIVSVVNKVADNIPENLRLESYVDFGCSRGFSFEKLEDRVNVKIGFQDLDQALKMNPKSDDKWGELARDLGNPEVKSSSWAGVSAERSPSLGRLHYADAAGILVILAIMAVIGISLAVIKH